VLLGKLLPMRVLAICHQRDAGPGIFADAIAAVGGELEQWFRAETDVPPADPASYDAVISFGGSMHADQEDEHGWLAAEKALLRQLLERGMPLLGVCLGAQLLSEAAGGDAHPAREPEIGWFEVEVTEEGAEDPLIGPLAPRFEAFDWHHYECGLPAHATVLARTPVCAQAFRVGEAAWGIQFHAEVSVADLEAWIDEYRDDADRDRAGPDPETLRGTTMPRMNAWNDLGRALCGRFLAAVARPGAAAPATFRPPSTPSSSSP
jgi:GMP synthase-like glutamine amidotransferase